MPKPIIGVIGAGSCDTAIATIAHRVGELIAQNGATLVCGGLGGVMEHAAKGAYEAGGETIGVLPGASASEANRYITVPIVTDMGHARNIIIAHTSEALIAIEGEYGTMSETAISLKLGKPVVAIGRMNCVQGVVTANTPEEAVELVMGHRRKR